MAAQPFHALIKKCQDSNVYPLFTFLLLGLLESLFTNLDVADILLATKALVHATISPNARI